MILLHSSLMKYKLNSSSNDAITDIITQWIINKHNYLNNKELSSDSNRPLKVLLKNITFNSYVLIISIKDEDENLVFFQESIPDFTTFSILRLIIPTLLPIVWIIVMHIHQNRKSKLQFLFSLDNFIHW